MILHTFSDGGARGNPGPAASAFVVCDAQGTVLAEGAECIGHATNNVAEYRGMILALEHAKIRKGTELLCHSDSELMIFQLQGIYRIKDARLGELARRVKSLAGGFKSVAWKSVRREHPMVARADKLLNQALNRAKATAPLRDSSGELF